MTGKDSACLPAGGRIAVCILIPRLATGGVETQVLDFLRHVDRSRFAVSLLCLSAGEESMENQARAFVEEYKVINTRLRWMPISFLRMVAFLRRRRFAILHCQLPLADIVGRPAGWLARTPVVVTTEPGRNVWKPWYYLLVERLLNRITDVRICVSRDILELRLTREHTPSRKLVYIPNGVDMARLRRPVRGREAVMAEFGWAASDVLVLSVGRLEPEKNYPLLVRAMLNVARSAGSTRCLIAGEGSARAEIARLIDRLGLADSVKIPGRRDDVADLLGAADVFVLSSLTEGLPVSLLEAMATGKAIVATAVGGVPEVIEDGVSGLLVEPGAEALLGQALLSLAKDPGLRLRLGEAAVVKAGRDLRIEEITERITDLYVSLYRRKQPAGGKVCGRPSAQA